MLVITDGIACTGKLKSNCCCNITGINFIKLSSLICMHLQNTSNTLLLAFGSIQYIRTGIHCSRVYTEECQLSNEGVCHNLKCQRRERLLIGRMSLCLIAIKVHALNCRYIGRRWHKFNHCIQQFLNALIPISSTATHRNSYTLAGSFS